MATSTAIAMLLLINSVRPSLHQLHIDRDLSQRAQARAELLCAKSQWSHAGWTDSFTGRKWLVIGENLAKGFDSVDSAEAALMASPTHKANITLSRFNKLGLGESCGIIVQLFQN